MISIIIPVYNEELIIDLLMQRIVKVMKEVNFTYELLIVNDGSFDNTLNLLKEYILKMPNLKIINLSRNFGQQAAYMAGITESKGDAIILLDADLQDPPEIIPELLNKWQEGFDIVLGARKSRKESFFKKMLFSLFHKLFSFLSDYPMPVNSGMFGLINRKVTNELLKLNEKNRFIPGLRDWLGFKSIVVWYDRQKREAGQPKQTFKKLLQMALDAIFSFSYKPLRLSLFFGLFVSFLSFTYGSILIIQRILQINYLKGFTTPTVAIFFLGGIILISTGIIGEYLGRIYDEVKQRPLFIISDILSSDKTIK